MTLKEFLDENPEEKPAVEKYAIELAERRRVMGIMKIAGIQTPDYVARMIENGGQPQNEPVTESDVLGIAKNLGGR